MTVLEARPQQQRQGFLLIVFTLWALVVGPGAGANGQQKKVDVLRIGSSGSIASLEGAKEKAALRTLEAFIKDETGLNNEILHQKNWRELAAKMAEGRLHVGVFQGFEFAWAQEKQPQLKPLAVAVNVYVYPVVYVVVKRDSPAKDFAGLKGQALAIPDSGQGFLRLFLTRQEAVAGKGLETFFSEVTTPDNVEDALDEVVEGKVQAAAADKAALEAYKRRKPGRFKQLRPVAQSQPFPPAVVAYYDSVLAPDTLNRLRRGLLEANQKERGQTMLTLFGISRFDPAPADFGKVLAAVRKAYPPKAGS